MTELVTVLCILPVKLARRLFGRKLSIIILLLLLFVSSSRVAGQVRADTLGSDKECSQYDFHLSLKPQPGYGLIFGYQGGMSNGNNIRQGYEMGIARSIVGREGARQESLSLIINNINHNLVYGFVVRGDIQALFDFGVSFNYMTDFSNRHAVLFCPSMGVNFLPILNISGTFEYNAPIAGPNFEIQNRWMFGIRYDFVFIRETRHATDSL
ncbi:MAG: hypothetical protein P4L45_15090 [Ignavibacteriaceae bacterium]|nr:hypothetical protein [Ignavibacteriaceae bacterium]